MASSLLSPTMPTQMVWRDDCASPAKGLFLFLQAVDAIP
jgi:hypothetical protein